MSEMKDHPISDHNIAFLYPDFTRLVARRLRAGADSYGDGSFSRTGDSLLDEIEQEALDIVGWGFVLWCRIQELKSRVTEAEERSAGLPPFSLYSRSHRCLLQRLKLFVLRSLSRLRRLFGAR